MANVIKEAQQSGVSSRELIFRRALQLFTEKGYDGTSIDDIRQATGFKSKASFYTHFKSKEELAHALLTNILEAENQILTEVYRKTKAEPLAQFIALGRSFIEWGLTHPQEYAFCFLRTQQEMLIQGRYSAETEQSNLPMLELIRQLRASYPVRAIADEALLSIVIGLISKAVIDQGSFGLLSLDEKVEQIIEMCLGVIFSEEVKY